MNKTKTITITENTFNQIKTYCSKNGLKIGWFTETTLVHYINNQEKHDNKK
jgi:hypothetical protein